MTARVAAPLRPRSVRCVIAHAHRSIAVADAVAAGKFTHCGITLDLGRTPDWHDLRLPADEEWRIEWTKFYFGLDLAHAFVVSSDQRYLRAWEGLVGSFSEQVPVGEDSSDVCARRIQNWVYAWDAFASASSFRGLSPEFESELLDSLADQGRFIQEHLTPERNHRTLELYALLLVSLALPEVDTGISAQEALDELGHNLLADVLPDGVHRERSTHYHLIALRSFLGARANAVDHGLVLPDGYDERLTAACEFALHCHRPDGEIPALSDSDSGRYDDVLAFAAEQLGRSDFLYAATAGSAGDPPARRHANFPLGGYVVQRSGWGERADFRDERFLIFDCGPLGDGGHGHYDALSVEVAAGGRPLIVDPGRYTYAEGEPNLRRWFKSTAAHNTVCVDGLDQTPYRRGKPKGKAAECSLVSSSAAPGLEIVVGEVRSSCYDAVHTRRIAFVADEYWLIEDVLVGGRRHRYDLRFHLAAETWGRTEVVGAAVRAPGLALVFAAELEIQLESGWVAPEYGVKCVAPVVSIAVEALAATFLTLVMPREEGAPTPVLVRSGDGVEVRTDAWVDQVSLDRPRLMRRAAG
ncbi:MAG: hypothetical protein HW413_25 [Thermoleophilia bacterium]|nr:hypothetical protein [Thermoleophilia bacterium]